MKRDDAEAFAERVQLARIWLQGFAVESKGVMQSKRVEEDTPLDRACRHALAQLLVDADAPREIMDVLATLIAPDSEAGQKFGLTKVGEQLFRSGDARTNLVLTGGNQVLRLRRRDNKRYSDGYLIGSIISLVREQTYAGASLETAFFEVSERAEAAGITKMSPSNVRKIWNKSNAVREKLFGARPK